MSTGGNSPSDPHLGLLLVAAAVLAGCDHMDYTPAATFRAAETLCQPHGGLDGATSETNVVDQSFVVWARCTDGTRLIKLVKP